VLEEPDWENSVLESKGVWKHDRPPCVESRTAPAKDLVPGAESIYDLWAWDQMKVDPGKFRVPSKHVGVREATDWRYSNPTSNPNEGYTKGMHGTSLYAIYSISWGLKLRQSCSAGTRGETFMTDHPAVYYHHGTEIRKGMSSYGTWSQMDLPGWFFSIGFELRVDRSCGSLKNGKQTKQGLSPEHACQIAALIIYIRPWSQMESGVTMAPHSIGIEFKPALEGHPLDPSLKLTADCESAEEARVAGYNGTHRSGPWGVEKTRG
jgi:hypothetical protein